MRNRKNIVPLSPQEKLDVLTKLEEKTLHEDYMYRRFLFLIGVGFSLVSIWVTFMIERMANYTMLGLSLNVLVGILFLYAAWRNLHHLQGKINRSIQIITDPKELRKRRELLESVNGFQNNKLELEWIESGVVLLLNWTPALLIGISRLIGMSHGEWLYEIIFPITLGIYSIMSEYVLIYIGENYHELNVLYQLWNELQGN
jgi:hypothetical protein